jgi:hypothetical protein
VILVSVSGQTKRPEGLSAELRRGEEDEQKELDERDEKDKQEELDEREKEEELEQLDEEELDELEIEKLAELGGGTTTAENSF